MFFSQIKKINICSCEFFLFSTKLYLFCIKNYDKMILVNILKIKNRGLLWQSHLISAFFIQTWRYRIS